MIVDVQREQEGDDLRHHLEERLYRERAGGKSEWWKLPTRRLLIPRVLVRDNGTVAPLPLQQATADTSHYMTCTPDLHLICI